MSPDLLRSLAGIQAHLRAGEGIALQLGATEAAYERLFPKQVSAALASDDVLRNAKMRWEEQHAALRRAALLQGQIADGIEADTYLLGVAMARSRGAAGALEVAQAGNELTALGVKQSLALQGLLAAQYRADTLAKAREIAAEEALGRGLIGLGIAGALMAGLKAIVLWFPPERIALANGWFIMLGALGAVSATAPAEIVLAQLGWRGLFAVLTAVTAAAAIVILLVVPERRQCGIQDAPSDVLRITAIYRDPRFWRLAPLSAVCIGSAWALQGL
jgi:MFS family permease